MTAWRKELAFNRIVYTHRRPGKLFVSARTPQIPIGVPFKAHHQFGMLDLVEWDLLNEDERANPETEPERARELPWEES